MCIITLQIFSPGCKKDYQFTLFPDRDVQNDRINGLLETLLVQLQQLNVPCVAEQNKADSGNPSLLDVCTNLKIHLQSFTGNISNYVSGQIWHVLLDII